MTPKVSPLKGRTGNPVANQYLIEEGGGEALYFQSYRSIVAKYARDEETGKYVLSLDSETWDCSVTTRKYLHQFIRTVRGAHAAPAREGVKSGEYKLVNLGGRK